uniref:Uncharacterized protein n=1 Tax=Candidatus Kentrum sp. MB TaxID=2138164 RepID=A0A450X9A0_9GAMM|nr:MAG: hypothetical protein BECKMB1821G_GA0114241_101625 [Candidatus Kentron sp. MB]VFK27198.1 MAG: hypothetical protein BECKMB1821I_GA0114274_100276 [Candidatus Kentron sp. MB]VFK75088.1 MAG: hypothetical protein BECKMB1821H_GA0114242_101525 [Candidatus Kentron sp. MB]
MCPNEKKGTIERINGVHDIENLESYYKHRLFVEEGQAISPTVSAIASEALPQTNEPQPRISKEPLELDLFAKPSGK